MKDEPTKGEEKEEERERRSFSLSLSLSTFLPFETYTGNFKLNTQSAHSLIRLVPH